MFWNDLIYTEYWWPSAVPITQNPKDSSRTDSIQNPKCLAWRSC
jgi:hypothetical protein